MIKDNREKVKKEFAKALERMGKMKDIDAFIFLTLKKNKDGETATGECRVSGKMTHLARLYNSVDKNVKAAAALMGMADILTDISEGLEDE